MKKVRKITPIDLNGFYMAVQKLTNRPCNSLEAACEALSKWGDKYEVTAIFTPENDAIQLKSTIAFALYLEAHLSEVVEVQM